MFTPDTAGKIESKGQTVLPRSVRRALGLAAGDSVGFDVRAGRVTLRAVTRRDAHDQALLPFLCMVASGLAEHPSRDAGPLPPVGSEGARGTAFAFNPDQAIDGDVAL